MKENKISGTRFKDRFDYSKYGSTLGTEIKAGLLMGILTVCGMFLNMNLVLQMLVSDGATSVNAIAANGELTAQMYFISMILGAAGSLVMGLVAGLPLVQVSGLGLGAVLISLGGSQAGLTYHNILAICLVSSLACTIVFAIPGLWEKIWRTIPKAVRDALPAALGILLAWTAIQLTGIIQVQGSAIPDYGVAAALSGKAQSVMLPKAIGWGGFSYATDKYHPQLLLNGCAVLLCVCVYFWLSKRSRHPLMGALLAGTAFFLLSSVCFVCVNWKNFGVSLDSMWGRLWTVGSEDAQDKHLFTVLSNFRPALVLKEGFDFTEYRSQGGSVAYLFGTGILTTVLTMMLDGGATLSAVGQEAGRKSEIPQRSILLCNAVSGVVAPLMGGVSLSIGKASVAGAKDGGRTGLAAVVASIVCLLSAFFWIVPFLFGTIFSYDIRFSMYGHYGAVLDILRRCSFAVADMVMVIVGVSMVAKSIQGADKSSASVFSVTVAASFFLSNLAGGVAAGILAWVLTSAKEEKKDSGSWLGCLFVTALSVLLLILLLK